VVIPLTNSTALRHEKSGWENLTLGEFFIYLELICFMLAYKIGGPRRKYWTSFAHGEAIL
jgi:hypothetical protein